MRYLKVLVIVLLFFFLLLFLVQNTKTLGTSLQFDLHLFDWKWTSASTPVYLLILLAFVAGAIVSLLYFLLDKLRSGRELKKYKNRINSLEKELESLRSSSSAAAAPSPAFSASPSSTAPETSGSSGSTGETTSHEQ
jgi:uncharacterized integral membrane protein